MTLVELIIFSAISVLVTVGLAALAMQGFRANNLAVSQDQANAQTQIVAMNLQTTLRNTCKVTIAPDGQSFDARVLTDGAWQTQHWTIADAGSAIDVATTSHTVTGSFGPAGSTVGFGSRVTYDLRIAIGDTHTNAAGAIQLQAYSNEASAGCS